MNTWLVIILVWIGLGVVVLGVERALARHSSSQSP